MESKSLLRENSCKYNWIGTDAPDLVERSSQGKNFVWIYHGFPPSCRPNTRISHRPLLGAAYLSFYLLLPQFKDKAIGLFRLLWVSIYIWSTRKSSSFRPLPHTLPQNSLIYLPFQSVQWITQKIKLQTCPGPIQCRQTAQESNFAIILFLNCPLYF